MQKIEDLVMTFSYRLNVPPLCVILCVMGIGMCFSILIAFPPIFIAILLFGGFLAYRMRGRLM